MSNQSMIHLELEFSGALLPVETNEQGYKVVPLKPIVEGIGLSWQTQMEKVKNTYLNEELGFCKQTIWYGGQRRNIVCVRLDRVASFLNSVNPRCVRAQKNEATASLLQNKQKSWGDALDAFERRFGVFSMK